MSALALPRLGEAANGTLRYERHRSEQATLYRLVQQHAQRDRQRQHPLPRRYVRNDMIHQVRCRLRHPPRTA